MLLGFRTKNPMENFFREPFFFRLPESHQLMMSRVVPLAETHQGIWLGDLQPSSLLLGNLSVGGICYNKSGGYILYNKFLYISICIYKFNIILYYIILYITLYYILHYIILYYILYYIIYYIILYYIMLCYIILYYIILYYIILYIHFMIYTHKTQPLK